ncbi:hypothetical protein LH991_06810 [Schleiferilactobacillus harbinensis]|uniref:hypothetical protein n=1 Tax=Schleiferilactobacillus harbinensis TaxID=304207 RepID=UPI0012660657|nr:hypothetical protein [Schleiferilactobacillus harbinensis]QFR63704.1 hypothetical protein LH991_06810 [Schleiferilactobacillus harbinensis]
MSTTTDFQKITEQISVPTNLVDAAITQGIQAAAPRRKQHRRRITIGLAVAVLLLGAAITPATIQAGGLCRPLPSCWTKMGPKRIILTRR